MTTNMRNLPQTQRSGDRHAPKESREQTSVETEVVAEAVPVFAPAIRAEIDSQVQAARSQPRSIHRYLEEATAMATIDWETAKKCCYSVTRGGKEIEGGTVRLAEIVAYAWTNLRTSSRIGEDLGHSIQAEAMCIDLERNTGMAITVTRRLTNAAGQRYGDDMVNMTANAAVSLALRNAIFRTIPATLVHPVYQAAYRVMKRTDKPFRDVRGECLEYFWREVGVGSNWVCRAIGVAGIADLTPTHIDQLRALAGSIKKGKIQASEAFPEWAAMVDNKT
jgi:hypothetical protein